MRTLVICLVVSMLSCYAMAGTIDSINATRIDAIYCLLHQCNNAITLDIIKDLIPLKKDELITIEMLVGAANKLGFRAFQGKLTHEEFRQSKQPMIALMNDDSCLALKWNNEKYNIMAVGNKNNAITEKSFIDKYSGRVIAVNDDEIIGKMQKNNENPSLCLDRYVYDLGEVYDDKQISIPITIGNRGRKNINITKIRPSCDCITIVDKNKVIESMNSTEIQVGIDFKGRSGIQNELVYIHSDDTITPIVAIIICCNVLTSQLDISKRELSFGVVQRGTKKKLTIVVNDRNGKDFAINGIVSKSEYIDVQLIQDEKVKSLYTVEVSLKGDIPYGEFKSTIIMNTTHRIERSVEIPVGAYVDTGIVFDPIIADFGVIAQGSSKCIELLAYSPSADFVITKIILPETNFTVNNKILKQNRKYAITLTSNDKLEKGIYKGKILVYTNIANDNPIKIPFYIYVE